MSRAVTHADLEAGSFICCNDTYLQIHEYTPRTERLLLYTYRREIIIERRDTIEPSDQNKACVASFPLLRLMFNSENIIFVYQSKDETNYCDTFWIYQKYKSNE